MQHVVEGIHRFQSEQFTKDQPLFEKLAGGQTPQVLLITCSDSRIAPNQLTQTKPGDLFILRTAGNIVPPYGSVLGGEAATIEYAVSALKIPDIVICGHSHCGAMAGLLSLDSLDSMPAVKAYLSHAEATRRIVEDHTEVTDAAERLMLTVQSNVLVQLENLRTHPAVAAAIQRGDVNLHGWVYKFETGDVLSYRGEQKAFLPLCED